MKIKHIVPILSMLLLFLSCDNVEVVPEVDKPIKSATTEEVVRPVLVIHGGAGPIERERLSEAQIEAYENALKNALDAGYKLLEEGKSSVDAVVAAIQVLEEDSLFNAGRGAVLTHDKTISLDASIMDGKTKNAGAVAGINRVKSPIELAKVIMNQSEHVMLSGEGAEEYALEKQLEMVSPSYFMTQMQKEALEAVLNDEEQSAYYHAPLQGEKMGTVGAIALDKNGNLAAGTSTGGMTNKKHGRIGDSPIIGAGTYAENGVCAVSCTGHGEFYIRNVIAYDVAARVKYLGKSIEKATQESLDMLSEQGGSGGIIAVDSDGNIHMPFNTHGMFRGYRRANGDSEVKMFLEE